MNIALKCSECKEELEIEASDIDLYHDVTYHIKPCMCVPEIGKTAEARIEALEDEVSDLESDVRDMEDAIRDAVSELYKREDAELEKIADDLENSLPW